MEIRTDRGQRSETQLSKGEVQVEFKTLAEECKETYDTLKKQWDDNKQSLEKVGE